jgi:serine protease Do
VQMISAAQPGSTVNLNVLRDGKNLEVPVRVGDRAQVVADNADAGASPDAPQAEAEPARLGVSVQNLSQSDRQQMGLTSGGVLVAGVEPGSFAEDIGIAKGDVIVAINRQPVSSAADVRNIVQAAKPGEAMAFKLMRNAGGNWNTLFTAGALPAK